MSQTAYKSKNFISATKAKLLEIKDEKDQDVRVDKLMTFLEQLNTHNDPETQQVVDIISNQILDRINDETVDIDTKKFFQLLYPNINYDTVPIIKSADKVQSELPKTLTVEPSLINIENKPIRASNGIIVTAFGSGQTYMELTRTNPLDTNGPAGLLKVLSSEPTNIQVQKVTKPAPISVSSIVSPQILSNQISNLNKVTKIKVIDNFYTQPLTLSSKTLMADNTSAVFFDVKNASFNKINGELSLLDTIKTDLSVKFNVDKLNIIVLQAGHPTDDLKNNPSIKAGPIIIMINNNMYDVYEKVETKIVKGYWYPQEYTNTDLIYIGKYGSLFV